MTWRRSPKPSQRHTPGDCYEQTALDLEAEAKRAYADGEFDRGDDLMSTAIRIRRFILDQIRRRSR